MSKRELEPADLGFVITLLFLLIFFGGLCYYLVMDAKESIKHHETEKKIYYQYKLDSLKIVTQSSQVSNPSKDSINISLSDSIKTK